MPLALHVTCTLCLCFIVVWSATQRNLWKAIWLLAFVWSNPDRPRRKALDFRAFVCPHISGQGSCVYSVGLVYHGHFLRVLDLISCDWCQGNSHAPLKCTWFWHWHWEEKVLVLILNSTNLLRTKCNYPSARDLHICRNRDRKQNLACRHMDSGVANVNFFKCSLKKNT